MSNTQAPAVRLKADAYAAWMERLKLAGVAQQAEFIGVSRPNLDKVLRGEVAPGERFIAATLAASRLKFEDLFEIVEAS